MCSGLPLTLIMEHFASKIDMFAQGKKRCPNGVWYYVSLNEKGIQRTFFLIRSVHIVQITMSPIPYIFHAYKMKAKVEWRMHGKRKKEGIRMP